MVNLTRLRSRSGHHPHHLNYQLHDKPSRERHLVSVLCSVFSILFLVLALSMKEWAKASNVSCDLVFGLTKVHVKHKNLSIYVKDYSMTGYYKEDQQILISCVISVMVLTILSSLIATIISLGYPRVKMEFLRHFSVFNVVSLLCTVLVSGLWLAVVQSLPRGRVNLTHCNFEKISVHFGYCYYIMLVGALFSLGAASFNLLFARTAADRRRRRRLRLRQQQNRAVVESRLLSSHQELTGLNLIPPVYTVLENGTTDTSGETETSLMGQSEQDNPASPPPPYAL